MQPHGREVSAAMRGLAADREPFGFTRIDDHQVAAILDRIAPVTLLDIEAAIRAYSLEPFPNAHRLQQAFVAALPWLDFRSPPDSGVLYSADYYGLARSASDQGSSLERNARNLLAADHKLTIDDTAGGRWLDHWRIDDLLPHASGEVRQRAAETYIAKLQGGVDVFLAYPDVDHLLRSVDTHPLAANRHVSSASFYLIQPVRLPEGVDFPLERTSQRGPLRLRFQVV